MPTDMPSISGLCSLPPRWEFPLSVSFASEECRRGSLGAVRTAVADELFITRITVNKNAIVEMAAFQFTNFLEALSGDYSWHGSPDFNKAVKDFHDRYALCTMQYAGCSSYDQQVHWRSQGCSECTCTPRAEKKISREIYSEKDVGA